MKDSDFYVPLPCETCGRTDKSYLIVVEWRGKTPITKVTCDYCEG